MKNVKYHENYRNLTEQQEVNKCYWNAKVDLMQSCTNLQFVKKKIKQHL